MTYSDDELFRFEKIINGYTLAEYCQKENKEITEIIIPEKYNDRFVVGIGAWAFENAEYLESVKLPESVRAISLRAFSCAYNLERVNIPKSVTEIAGFAFNNCFNLKHIEIPDGVVKIGQCGFADSSLKTIVLPKSLEFLGDCAFENCIYLENVIFNSVPVFGRQVFKRCGRLPADITLMGLVNSYDITQPLDVQNYNWMIKCKMMNIFSRLDVFDLALKNDCFRSVDKSGLLKFLVEEGFVDRLLRAEKYGLLDNPSLLGELTEYSVRLGRTEITAYLLNLKNRKFGFDGGNGYDL